MHVADESTTKSLDHAVLLIHSYRDKIDKKVVVVVVALVNFVHC